MSPKSKKEKHYKIIRDAVHFDTEFDRDEIDVINTREFQRLRRIRQLGLAYLVYPSASHTRFEHALGVCHMAQSIIDVVNRADPDTITEEDRTIIRYLALLHDIGHVPFGHTLEDERPVLDNKHDGDDRLNFFLKKGELGKQLEKVEREIGPADLREKIVTILSHTKKAGDSKRSAPPKEKLFANIVGNTICADLLDYLKRDTTFTGIQHRYDDRIIRSFRIKNQQIYIHLTDDRSTRTGLLSEILHLLRLRYTLGERVYYHRTKAAASAMISKAVELLSLRAEDLLDVGDDELLFILENPEILISKFPRLKNVPPQDREASKRIASLLRKRSLYQPVFRITRSEAEAKHQKADLVSGYYSCKGSARQKVEAEISKACDLKPGQAVVYCPEGDMSLKEAEVQVSFSPDSGLEILKDVTDRNVKDDIAALQEKHRSLWFLEVLLDPDLVQEKGKRVATVFQSHHKTVTNDIAEFRSTGAEELEYAALLEAAELGGKPVSVVRELMEAAHKEGRTGLVTADKWIKAFPQKLTRDLFSATDGNETEPKSQSGSKSA